MSDGMIPIDKPELALITSVEPAPIVLLTVSPPILIEIVVGLSPVLVTETLLIPDLGTATYRGVVKPSAALIHEKSVYAPGMDLLLTKRTLECTGTSESRIPK